jgi:hypothetical protein
MSLIVANPGVAPRSALRSLTVRESLRMAASPLLLILVAAAAASLVSALRPELHDPDGLAGTLASFIGGFGFIAAFWLTTSTGRSEIALGVTPTSPHTRTVALCLSALVPLTAGVLSFVAVEVFQHTGSWPSYGVLSSSDQTLLWLSQLVLPSLGGPLLGIALARWWPGPWVPVAAFLVMVAWLLVIQGVASYFQNSSAAVWLRLFAPFTLFVSSGQAGGVETWRGSVGWFLAWQVALCLLAITIALLRNASPEQRRRLRIGLAAILIAALSCYVLASLGGLQHAVITSPAGQTRPL